ncbi:hypothetical protein ACI3L1_13075 [Deinococcus sp. SM5_A1]|uniref:hypothetical protein n=1 Tax=Deinococcus sp. SM5_A1 TaxID=3379094 RepID=UPI003858B95F
MKASEWLVRATGDLPTGVTARVKADTLAHLQDAGLDREADVRPVLGRPEDTAAELRRLYLTNREWQGFSPQPSLLLRVGEGMQAFLWPAILIWSLFEPLTPLHGNWPLWWGIAVVVSVFLSITQRQHPALRRLWRELLASWSYPATLVMLPGRDPVFIALALTLFVYATYTIWHRIARLSRTLTLEGERA